MLVKSLYSDIREIRSLPTPFSRELDGWFGPATHDLDLTVDKVYVVYAIEITDGWLRYFVTNDRYDPGHFVAFPPRVPRSLVRGCRQPFVGVLGLDQP
jgi:hypothetical protein